jgi:hypothetical protein
MTPLVAPKRWRGTCFKHTKRADMVHGWRRDINVEQGMGMRAAEVVALQFDLNQQADAYLAWYKELVEQLTAERLARTN